MFGIGILELLIVLGILGFWIAVIAALFFVVWTAARRGSRDSKRNP